MAAHARCLTTGGRLHHLRKAGRTHKRIEAESGSLVLGLTRSQSGSVTSVASLLPAETGPLPVIGYPHTGGRCYVTNEQLSRLTPFSQQAAPGLAWRTQDRGEKGEAAAERVSASPWHVLLGKQQVDAGPSPLAFGPVVSSPGSADCVSRIHRQL